MEMTGINCAKEAESLSNALRNSPLYIDSKIRLNQASLTGFPSIIKDYTSLRDLDFAVTTMADYASLETHILTYAIHSFPEWWTNPFEKEKGKESPLSLGSLLIDDKGEIITIDSLIEEVDISEEEKLSLIEERIDGWHKDQSERLLNAISTAKEQKNFNPWLRGITDFFSFILLIFGNLFVAYVFSNELLRPFVNAPDKTYLSTYAIYIPLVFCLIYDFLFSLKLVIQSRRYQGIYYVMNFSRKKLEKVLRSLNYQTAKLSSYLKSHVRSKTTCDKDSINYFVFEESKVIKGIEKVGKEPPHRILEACFLTFFWLFAFVLAFGVIVVVINMQRGIAI